MASLFSDLQIQLDESSGLVFFDPDQVRDNLNLAQLSVYINVKEWLLTSATFTMSASSDIIGWSTASIMIPQYIIYNGPSTNTAMGNKLFPTTHDLLEDWSSNWRQEPKAQPQWYVPWDWSHIRLWPNPDQAYSGIIYGTPWPVEITTSTQDADPSMDPLLRKAIILRACAFLFEETQPELADAKQSEAAELENRFAVHNRTQLGANVLRLRPVVGWTLSMQGNIARGRRYSGIWQQFSG